MVIDMVLSSQHMEDGHPYSEDARYAPPTLLPLKKFKLATVYLEPTEHEVENGAPNSYRYCPYAMAINRQLGELGAKCDGVTENLLRLGVPGDILRERRIIWKVPQDAAIWIKRYDRCHLHEGMKKPADPPVIVMQVPEILISERGMKT